MKLWYIKLFISLPSFTYDSVVSHPYLLLIKSIAICIHYCWSFTSWYKPRPGSLCSSYISAYEPKACALRAQFTKEPNLIGTNRYWYRRSLSLTIFEHNVSRARKPYWLNPEDFCDPLFISPMNEESEDGSHIYTMALLVSWFCLCVVFSL